MNIEVNILSGEREKASEPKGLPDCVDEVDVRQLSRSIASFLGCGSAVKSEREVYMSLMTDCNAHVWDLIEIAAADECAFVGPPVNIAPVGLVVFEELTIELEVLSDLDHDVVGLDIFVPSARTEGEGSHCCCNIHDASLLCAEFL